MGRFFSNRNQNCVQRTWIFLIFLFTTLLSFSQNGYTEQWFLDRSYDNTILFHKDSLLPDTSVNAWHNALLSFAKKNYSKANYYWLKDNRTNDTLKTALQGQILYKIGVLDEAKTIFQSMTTTDDPSLKQFLTKSLGDILYKQKQYDSAQFYYQQSFDVQVKQSRYLKSEIYENLAYISMIDKNLRKANTVYHKVLNIYKNNEDSMAMARTYSNLGNLFFEQYEDLKAKQYFDSAYVIAKPLKDLKLQGLITYNLYLTNEILKNKDIALKYYKENSIIEDSIQRQNFVWEISKQKEAFAVAQKQSEIDLKTAERNTFIVVSIGVFLILILGVFAYRRLKKQHQEIRQLNNKLDKLNTAKDQLFTIIAHDLRSPVALLKQVFQLQKFQQNESQITSINQDIPKILDSLSMLLDNLLNWAMSQSNLLQVQKDWFPLQPILKQILEQYQGLIEEKNIQFSINISRSVLIHGDIELLKVALRNSLDNAIKFTPIGGSIQFKETKEGSNYTLSLIDSGIGIPNELLEQLFEMNSSKIQKDTSGRKSSGLGLLLTQSMIQLNDGQLSIKQNPTGGTIINITLPFKTVA